MEKPNAFFPSYIQKNTIDLLNSFRREYMCQYGVIFENLKYEHDKIINKNPKINPNRNKKSVSILLKMKSIIEKFSSEKFVHISYKDREKWESFFNLFEIPIWIDDIKIKSIQYNNGFYIADTCVQYSYHFIKNSEQSQESHDLINYLLNIGYKVQNDISDSYAIGYEFSYNFPYTIEEQLYFQAKFLYNYNLFALWDNIAIFYMQKSEDNNRNKLLTNDLKFHLYIKHVVEELFQIHFKEFDKVPFHFCFKHSYDCLNKDIVDILYNRFLFSKIQKIEIDMRQFINKRHILNNMINNKES